MIRVRTFFPVLLLLQLSFLPAMSQLHLQIITKTDRSDITKVEAFDLSQQEIHDKPYSDTVIFHFNKTNIDCYNIRFVAGNKMLREQLWLDTGNVIIKGTIDKDKFIIDTVINSPFYYQLQAYYDSAEVYRKTDTFTRNNFLLGEMRKHINNPFSLAIAHSYLSLNQNSMPRVLQMKELLDLQGDKFKWFLIYTAVSDRMNAIINAVHLDMPGYKFTNTADKVTGLELKEAQFYVLDLWFLACAPCIEQHKQIKAKQQELTNYKTQVIGISTDNNYNPWKKYLSDHNYDWKNLRQHAGKTITTDLGISTFPTYIIVNGNGDIIKMYNSFESVLEFLSTSQVK